MKYTTVLCLAGLISGAVVSNDLAFADSDLRNKVMERKKIMKSMLRSYFPLMAIHKGKSTDFQKAVAAIDSLKHGMLDSAPLFVEGTAKGDVPGSRAKPEVWSASADFKAAADELVSAADQLAAAAQSGDLQAFKTQFELMDAACRACHEFKPSAGGRFRFAKIARICSDHHEFHVIARE